LQSYSVYNFRAIKTHWRGLDVKFGFNEDTRSWQEILDKIANDLVSTEEVDKFKRKINGSLSGTNGSWKRKYPDRGLDEFINEIMAKFNNANDAYILEHPDFGAFVRKRSMLFFITN